MKDDETGAKGCKESSKDAISPLGHKNKPRRILAPLN